MSAADVMFTRDVAEIRKRIAAPVEVVSEFDLVTMEQHLEASDSGTEMAAVKERVRQLGEQFVALSDALDSLRDDVDALEQRRTKGMEESLADLRRLIGVMRELRRGGGA